MAKIIPFFPQISRIFNAGFLSFGVKTLVLGVLAAFLFINLYPSLSADFLGFERAKIAVMLYPADLSSHLILAQEYLRRGRPEEMERELLLAQEVVEKNSLTTNPSVLGTTLSPLEILVKVKNEPEEIKKEIAFWEKEILEKSDYRDAYLQLAILDYRLYENAKAREYLQKALELDPNFGPTKELERLIPI